MSSQNVKMSKFKRTFQLLAANVPQCEICEKLHMGHDVLTRYKNIVNERRLSYLDISRISNTSGIIWGISFCGIIVLNSLNRGSLK